MILVAYLTPKRIKGERLVLHQNPELFAACPGVISTRSISDFVCLPVRMALRRAWNRDHWSELSSNKSRILDFKQIGVLLASVASKEEAGMAQVHPRRIQ